uniref:Uncharacterized protein n=1 Tax=Anguilla anguilla TaxID=7936 RepID=A0A0E9W3W8_ANGAN
MTKPCPSQIADISLTPEVCSQGGWGFI